MKLKVKNWADFQHYKDRAPPWIKLHKHILDNYEFHCLPVASRALAPCLWLIASEDLEGVIDAAPEKLAFRLRQTPKEIAAAVQPLIDKGFFIVVQDASEPLAESKQSARLVEKSREETDLMSGTPDEKKVLDHLNVTCGSSFEAVESNLAFIRGRLKEYGVEKLLRVIDSKALEWRGTDQEKYLRPATLFNAAKCAQYVGRIGNGTIQVDA